jgi:hypothetical protein
MKSKKCWLIGISSIILFISFGIYKYQFIEAYLDNAKSNHFKKGDNIYANRRYLNLDTTTGVIILRLYKNSDGKHRPIKIGWIANDNLLKSHSDIVGTYLDYKLVPFIIKDTTKTFCLYIIRPKFSVISTKIKEAIPNSYFLEDENYYLLSKDPIIKQ